VPVGEGVGLDDDALADRALERVAPAVDLRRDGLDRDPAAALARLRPGAARASAAGCGRFDRSRLRPRLPGGAGR
jgi:hypothetical protein